MAGGRQSGTDLSAEAFKAVLLWQKNESLPQSQHGKGSTSAETKILTELLGNGDLSLFTDPGGRQIFEHYMFSCHTQEIPVGISYQNE